MAKKALIAEPDVDEARKQAAILADDGYEVTLLTSGDLMAELERLMPDVVVLRHERPGQNGLALVQRIKRQPRLGGAAVVLTTSDLPSETLARHRAQRYRADAYVRLPVRRQDLLDAAHSVPAVLEAADVAKVEAEPPRPSDPSRPPPLPPRGLGRLPSPRTSDEPILTSDDLKFVEDVFSTIQEVSSEEHAKPPPEVEIPESGPDRKLALLRAKVRDYEHQLGRLKVLWRGREEELRAAEQRVEAKAVEIEGLHLRIHELEEELKEAQRTLDEKVAEFGRSLSEQFDQLNLREAELIQEVASKEHEVNKLRRQLAKTEEEKERLQKELSERIFEWERAYRELEDHHWKVVEASADEVTRLEAQIAERDRSRRALDERARRAETGLAYERERRAAAEAAFRNEQRERAEERDRLLRAAHIDLVAERRGRLSAEAERERLRLRVLDLEIALFRHDRLLRWLDDVRRRELLALSTAERDAFVELQRARAEIAALRAQRAKLEAVLSKERAFGEAAVHELFSLGDKERVIARAQKQHRDARIAALERERATLEEQLSGTKARLLAEEKAHQVERARAAGLAKELADAREVAAADKRRLEEAIAALEREGEQLKAALEETSRKLVFTQAQLAEERQGRAKEREEHRLALERKESEAKEREAQVKDLERDLEGAREDIQGLKSALASRDERIAELNGRAREADEQIVRLEAANHRLETCVAEQKADLEARAGREATLQARLAEREAWNEALSSKLEGVRADLEATSKSLEKQKARAAELEAFLEAEEAAKNELKERLKAREAELEKAQDKSAALERALADARAEIGAGQALVEDLQAELDEHKGRLEELRTALAVQEGRARALDAALRETSEKLEEERRAHAGEKATLERRVVELEAHAKALEARLSKAEAAHQTELARITQAYEAEKQRLFEEVLAARKAQRDAVLRMREGATPSGQAPAGPDGGPPCKAE